MDLSFLIPSKVRRSVLEYFVKNPEVQVYVRELARELALSPQLVYRELLNMENWGLLFSTKRGNQRVFRLNKKFILFSTLSEIFQKIEEENSGEYQIDKVLDWKKLEKIYQKIPISQELIAGLNAKRKKPRAYTEEKILKRRGLL